MERVEGYILDAKIWAGNLREITGVSDPDDLILEEFQRLVAIFHRDDEKELCPLCLWIKNTYKKKLKEQG